MQVSGAGQTPYSTAQIAEAIGAVKKAGYEVWSPHPDTVGCDGYCNAKDPKSKTELLLTASDLLELKSVLDKDPTHPGLTPQQAALLDRLSTLENIGFQFYVNGPREKKPDNVTRETAFLKLDSGECIAVAHTSIQPSDFTELNVYLRPARPNYYSAAKIETLRRSRHPVNAFGDSVAIIDNCGCPSVVSDFFDSRYARINNGQLMESSQALLQDGDKVSRLRETAIHHIVGPQPTTSGAV